MVTRFGQYVIGQFQKEPALMVMACEEWYPLPEVTEEEWGLPLRSSSSITAALDTPHSSIKAQASTNLLRGSPQPPESTGISIIHPHTSTLLPDLTITSALSSTAHSDLLTGHLHNCGGVASSATSLYTSLSPSPQHRQLETPPLDQLWRKFLTSSLAVPPQTSAPRNCSCQREEAVEDGLCGAKPQTEGRGFQRVSQPGDLRGPKVFETPSMAHHQRVDRGVQTTPSLFSPPTFSVPQEHHLRMAREPPSLTLSQLTLQEALRVQRPEFIQHSQRRVQRVRERVRTRPPPVGGRSATEDENQRTPTFYPAPPVKQRPRMTRREMYQHSKRYWERLPEVKEKEREEKRRSQAATNRLRVQLYQKEVLARLRLRHSCRT